MLGIFEKSVIFVAFFTAGLIYLAFVVFFPLLDSVFGLNLELGLRDYVSPTYSIMSVVFCSANICLWKFFVYGMLYRSLSSRVLVFFAVKLLLVVMLVLAFFFADGRFANSFLLGFTAQAFFCISSVLIFRGFYAVGRPLSEVANGKL